MKRWYFDIDRVEQGNNHGCAIACVATVCGVTYKRARHEFFGDRFHDDIRLHVTQQQMIEVIKKLGFNASLCDTGSFVDKRRPALVPFSWDSHDLDGHSTHTVVWNPFEKCIIDPGPDHYTYHDTVSDVLRHWKRSNYKFIVVTGKK